MELGLAGKYAVVTGGTHGIGLATAMALADEGCNIAVCSRTKARVERTLTKLKSKNVDCFGMQVDVLEKGQISRFCKEIISRWNTLDILVNNVGGGGRWGSEVIEDTNDDVWIDVYNKNALAAVRFTKFFLPFMRRNNWGRVVTVASRLGREGGGRPWFNMANSAEISFMKTMAMRPDLVRDGVTFNSVAPGGIMIPDTGWEQEMKDNPGEITTKINEKFPLGRLGLPEEVGNLIVFICSEKASLLNGASIAIDGGESRAF